ncbi:type II toxin-antitoxin system RelE/ParE family toxin [Myxococcota bacterium]|nr:type II toxin-antitoxin system RelE/ParE family toxin [Myxococcota bacterium]
MTARRVRIHAELRKDLRRQLAWLERHRDPDYIERLRNGLEEVLDRLAELPAVGPPLAREGPLELRKLLLRDLPYVVWFIDDADLGEVWLVRLFHVRQDHPIPELQRWPRRSDPTRRRR